MVVKAPIKSQNCHGHQAVYPERLTTEKVCVAADHRHNQQGSIIGETIEQKIPQKPDFLPVIRINNAVFEVVDIIEGNGNDQQACNC